MIIRISLILAVLSTLSSTYFWITDFIGTWHLISVFSSIAIGSFMAGYVTGCRLEVME